MTFPDKILLDNFNEISPERRKQIREDYINMCMNRKDNYSLLFPVDKIFKNIRDDNIDEDNISVKRLNNINYMTFNIDYWDFFQIDGVKFTRYEENLTAFYREYNEDDLLLIEVFKLFLPGIYHHPTKRVELDKNGKGIKILKFETADEFAIYCTKRGGVYSVRDRDCIPIEELRGRQAIVILKDAEDNEKTFNDIDLEIVDYIEDPVAISYKFIKKITTKVTTTKSKPKPVLKRVMRF